MQTFHPRHDLGRLFAAQMIYPEPARSLPNSAFATKEPAAHDFLVLNPGAEFVGETAAPAAAGTTVFGYGRL